MKTVIFVYLIICLAVCIFKRVMPLILAVGFLASWYMICYGNMVVTGIVLGGIMCLATTLYKVSKGETLSRKQDDRTQNRTDRKGNETFNPRWIYYLIPIFWPFLIVRILVDDKQKPTDMTPYDYEQHLKCNR